MAAIARSWATKRGIGPAALIFWILLAALPLIGLCALIARKTRHDSPGLYGDTGWAKPREMKAGKLSLKRRPIS